jgi:hypothetical protein
VYIGQTRKNIHAGNEREVRLAGYKTWKSIGTLKRRIKSEYLGCFRHWCLCMPNWHKPIGNNDEKLHNRYEKTMRRLQNKRRCYTVVFIWGCEFRKLLLDYAGLESKIFRTNVLRNLILIFMMPCAGVEPRLVKYITKSRMGKKSDIWMSLVSTPTFVNMVNFW